MVVTSFGVNGMNQYGIKFLDTYLKHCDEPLVVYVEEFSEELKPYQDRVTFRDLFAVPGMVQFLETCKAHPQAMGRVQAPKTAPTPYMYNYRYDAFKFARKVFAVTDAFRLRLRVDTDLKYSIDDPIIQPLTWIDADTVFLKDIPYGFFKSILRGCRIGFLGRKHMYSECGYMSFENTPMLEPFMDTYKTFFTSGAFTKLEQWHDCQVFDTCRLLYGLPEMNVSGQHAAKMHPFVNSVLGEYMDHLKGDRKNQGKSNEADYK